MNRYQEAYRLLNTAQRQAVDTIEGPVMVIAGPGTGKTQLLGVRVAHILQRTDVAANNILCLTFTESAAAAMRERLVKFMGADAYRVAIHTFHSFGTELINQYPTYFYEGARFKPADTLSSFEILQTLLSQLPHTNPLAKTMNGEFTMLRSAQQAISHLKKAGLTPDELRAVLLHNQAFIEFAEPLVAKAFTVPRLSAKQLDKFYALTDELKTFESAILPIELAVSLKDVCVSELSRALEDTAQQNTTKPLAKWRAQWLEYNHKRQFIFKDRARTRKLQALADLYQQYIAAMEQHELFDFDDMIMRAIHALETHPELRYNLQEQYLYIMVDEFQDTNGAQTRLLHNLLDNPVHEGRPNILVVGDDDQAIYAFQGAEASNMLQFAATYKDPAIVTLKDNYRSTQTVLEHARQIITQADNRLETSLQGIDKQLTPHNTHEHTDAQLHQFDVASEQYVWITQQIKQLLKDGTHLDNIAILGRNHRQLLEILPHLHASGIPVNYERRNNALEAEHIVALITLANVVNALGQQDFAEAEALMPMLLSYTFWGIPTKELWQLSLKAYQEQRLWLELMLESGEQLHDIAEFLIIAGHLALHEPLETMLDMLIGNNDTPVDLVKTYSSPLRNHYFDASILQNQPEMYLNRLSSLKAIRNSLKEYRPDQILTLVDFVDFVELHQKTGLPVVDTGDHHEAPDAVQLMTAHKAKGLEFDAVFVLSAQESVWGSGARHQTSPLSFPYNLPIQPAGQNLDDCLRLFFVAITRAKHHLYLCSFQSDDNGKASSIASFLQQELFKPIQHEARPVAEKAKDAIPNQQSLPGVSHVDLQQLLAPVLATYKLSATHLNNFIDVPNGGPQTFLLQNLLRFPQAMNLHATFGSAIHHVLQRAHVHLASSGERRPVEDILHDFETQLQSSHLGDRDFLYLLEKGSDILQAYLAKRYTSFNATQKAEFSFASQGVVVGEARLTGAIDLLEIDEESKTITVVDYKTGKPAPSWQGRDDFEKIKLHKYRQQLMMYKILVENSRAFGGKYTVQKGILEFVEPDADGEIIRLELEFDAEEIQQFKRLIQAVWQKIMALDLEDVSGYPAGYRGVGEFEEAMLAPKI
jgi:DNA helicase-2/ATP-dependent DNA helicase PcrA